MLDTATKRRIDTARDILVGKVPDPKSQVEQITIALIYKFMDDMDAEAEELGGNRSFFAGDFARYGWARLMRSGLGGHEALNLYSEAIARMPENPGIPALFRDIFKNAFLPYRDPETLRAFLKVVDEFEYDHSERLGDAFEYLLSVLGSQGDAGQFRTPRHIIDFIVDIVDPTKGETILDPACGTAGFLISAWKHIQAANRDEDGDSTLSPDEQERLAANVKGHDISPDMVRLSLANMYLHGFTDPHIFEYDTLTSDERWNEYADVILANPPFMSPKGGIRPHNRFSISATRSEVLFVDYIAEHLTPNGRAGVIVPEGVIFQSGKAYKALRKLLVENYLVAVISLPAGVFNPYSNTKTSVLILNRGAAKVSDTIGFFKLTNDGFSLGAQRREISGNEIPDLLIEIAQFRAHAGRDPWEGRLGFAVPKEKIVAGDYGLNAERYRSVASHPHKFPTIRLGEVCTINPSKRELAALNVNTEVSFVPMAELREQNPAFVAIQVKPLNEVFNGYTYFRDGDVLVAKVTPCFENGKAGIAHGLRNGIGFGSSEFYVLRPGEKILPRLVYAFITHPSFREGAIASMTGTGGLQRVPKDYVDRFEIPLPPLSVQHEIVAEIETYQDVIDGARSVLDSYRAHIDIDPEWPTKAIGDVCDLINGSAFKPEDWSPAERGGLPIVRIQNLNNPDARFNYFTGEIRERFLIEHGELLFSWSGSRGTSFGAHIWRGGRAILNQHIFKVLFDEKEVMKEYLHHALNEAVETVEENLHGGVGLVHITKGNLEKIEIPLPSIETQREIVAELEAERRLVEGNRELITRMEKKVKAAVARVWGATEHEDADIVLAAE